MIKLILGDCLTEMRKMPDKSVDLVLTDPPYGINKAEWDSVYPAGFEVEVVQWKEDNWDELEKFCPYGITLISKNLTIETLEGRLHVSKGDYIIKGIQGEYYPCKPDIFKLTYNCLHENKQPATDPKYKFKCIDCGEKFNKQIEVC